MSTNVFPSTEGLSVTDQGEIIYGGSFGINRVIERFKTDYVEMDHPKFDTLFINVFTLVRNCWDKSLTIDELYNRVMYDVELLLTYFDAYTSGRDRRYATTGKAVIYVPDYSYIQLNPFRRTLTGNKLLMHQMYVTLCKKYLEDSSTEGSFQSTQILQCRCGDRGRIPHLDLLKHVKRWYPQWRSSSTLLLSNVLMDYHICRHLNSGVSARSNKGFSLIESNTGKIIPFGQFWKKLKRQARLDEKYPNLELPFNKYTHILFGDDYLVQPMIKGKKKYKFIDEVIIPRRWHTRTEHDISKDMMLLSDLIKDIPRLTI